MFKCLKSDFPQLEKRINAISKKLDKYGLSHNFEIMSESVELIPVYEIVENAGHLEQVKRESQPMDVINYNFTMQTLKLGDYIPVAVLEHNAIADNDKNIIYLIDKTITVPQAWTTVSGKCEHCNSSRQRNKTVILQDTEGNYKQVGTTCIKDFTGIDGSDIISVYADVQSILINDICYVSEHFTESKYTNTVNYLAHCIDLINTNGYQKEETKVKAYEMAKRNHPTESAQKKAIEIIDFFAQFENIDDMQKLLKSETAFYWNIATALQNEYAKMSGFIAYALIAYNKAVEIISKNQTKEAVKAISQYQFNINDKITISVVYIHSFSYEASYNGGYSSTTNFIHLFKDENGNVFKWTTANCINVEAGDKINLVGTVKRHTEYQGEKQTELTRCKIK